MSAPPAAPDAARDERLARLLAELTEALHRGGKPDVDAVARQHPDLAGELRELWAMVQLAEEFSAPNADRPLRPAAAPPANLPRSFGDYELLAELGRGGMGLVYKAEQRSLGRTVALKMILRGNLASPDDLARFRAEAASAARLDHPNIVPVYEVGEDSGQAYFSMKYIDGTTLAARVKQGPLPPREAARLLVPICRAVHHA